MELPSYLDLLGLLLDSDSRFLDFSSRIAFSYQSMPISSATSLLTRQNLSSFLTLCLMSRSTDLRVTIGQVARNSLIKLSLYFSLQWNIASNSGISQSGNACLITDYSCRQIGPGSSAITAQRRRSGEVGLIYQLLLLILTPLVDTFSSQESQSSSSERYPSATKKEPSSQLLQESSYYSIYTLSRFQPVNQQYSSQESCQQFNLSFLSHGFKGSTHTSFLRVAYLRTQQLSLNITKERPYNSALVSNLTFVNLGSLHSSEPFYRHLSKSYYLALGRRGLFGLRPSLRKWPFLEARSQFFYSFITKLSNELSCAVVYTSSSELSTGLTVLNQIHFFSLSQAFINSSSSQSALSQSPNAFIV